MTKQGLKLYQGEKKQNCATELVQVAIGISRLKCKISEQIMIQLVVGMLLLKKQAF